MHKKALLYFLVLFLTLPVLVFAQPLDPDRGRSIEIASEEFKNLNTNQLVDIIFSIAEWFLILLGVVAIVIALVAAFQFITASDNEEQLSKAKKTLIWAVVGVVVAIIAFSIVRITNSLLSSPDSGPSASIELTSIS